MSHHNKAMFGTFKQVDGAKGLVIEGWANKAIVDRGGDIIPKSAWQLDNFKKNAIILWNHDKSRPIGKAQIVEAKDEGLYVKARISASADPEISKIRDLVKEGVLNAFSVGFDMIDSAQTDKGVTEIKAAELFEISIVSLPMNQDSLFQISKSYDYDEAKALVLEEADAHRHAEAAEAETEKAKEDVQPEAPVEAKPSDESAPEVSATGEKKELELQVQAIRLPKDQFETLEAATEWAKSNGWDVSKVSEDVYDWIFDQKEPGELCNLQTIYLDDYLSGMRALIGVCGEKPEAPEAPEEAVAPEDGEKAVSEADEKDLPTVPLPSEAPVVDLPEAILQARQTNIILGQVVAELQAVRAAITQLAQAMPPKQVSPPVEVAEPQVVAPPPAQLSLDEELVAKDTDIVRQYVEAINKTLLRIGA